MTTIALTSRQTALLERHLDELDLWNRRLNLTAVPRDRAWEKHVGESLELLDAAQLAEGAAVLDLGSGGGVPGVVVAVARPDVAVTLVESDQRKAGFLVHVAGLLELGNVTVQAVRAEALADDPRHRERYDDVVSRAAAPPERLVALALPLLRPSGTLVALVADAPATAAALGGTAAGVTAAGEGILVVRKPPGASP